MSVTAQIRCELIITICENRIDEIEQTRPLKISDVLEKIRNTPIVTGMLWWRKSRLPADEAEVIKIASRKDQEDNYISSVHFGHWISILDIIDRDINRKISKYERLRGIATTSLAFGSDYVTLTDKEIDLIS